MRSIDKTSALSSEFFAGIAFGTNVFLRCHTDADFTMSISQVFLKGRPKYQLNDHVIAYFCFLTLGVAVPLRPGDYFMFNRLTAMVADMRPLFFELCMSLIVFDFLSVVNIW